MPLPADTAMGAVHLAVSDLGRSVDWYTRAIGLEVLSDGGGEVSLGAGGRELLHLVEEPGARPADGYAGLYHFALLVPERADLARWLAYAARDRVPLTGASDHFVSEALYLRDPDHHGIEIYRDRPREQWEGQVRRMTTLPLDLDDLLATPGGEEPFTGLAPGTRMGHVHLRVADVEQAVAFYTGEVGFDLMARFGDQAGFLAAGGYHHHLGVNSWESRGAPPAPEGTARLLRYTIVAPGVEPAELRDPSGNVVALTP